MFANRSQRQLNEKGVTSASRYCVSPSEAWRCVNRSGRARAVPPVVGQKTSSTRSRMRCDDCMNAPAPGASPALSSIRPKQMLARSPEPENLVIEHVVAAAEEIGPVAGFRDLMPSLLLSTMSPASFSARRIRASCAGFAFGRYQLDLNSVTCSAGCGRSHSKPPSTPRIVAGSQPSPRSATASSHPLRCDHRASSSTNGDSSDRLSRIQNESPGSLV